MAFYGTGRYTLGIQPMINDYINRQMIAYFINASNPYPSWLAMATDTAWLADGHPRRQDDTYYVVNGPDGLTAGNLTMYHIVGIYTCQSTAGSSFPLDCVTGAMQGPGDIPALPIVTLLGLPASGYFDPPNFIGDPGCEAFAYDEPPTIPDFWALCFSFAPVKGDPHVAVPEYCLGVLPSNGSGVNGPYQAWEALTTTYPVPPYMEANDTSYDQASNTHLALLDKRKYTS